MSVLIITITVELKAETEKEIRRMNKQSIRDIFDIISLNVIGFLENHIGVSDVDFVERSGVAEMSITKWEEENTPF